MNSRVEILAPAGSMESMMAAVHAGADAIYMGGSRFGARAYADNPEEDRFLEAIDYAHLHGCRLYMTVNTLVKEEELDQLYDFLKPYYERGLDAVIVQDLGVWRFIREHFPDLPIHASTQMTVTGWRSAKILKEMGATRVVTARELSLQEIAQIRDRVDVEIESFVHGALCYCYSGQCLLSSLIGGRSGNRGRCAQPCRLPYDVLTADGKPVQSAAKQAYAKLTEYACETGMPASGKSGLEKKNCGNQSSEMQWRNGHMRGKQNSGEQNSEKQYYGKQNSGKQYYGKQGSGRQDSGRQGFARQHAGKNEAYSQQGMQQKTVSRDERYVLSLKDLCTLDILPDIIESGVYSLKIEGRMKSPRYTAGVVSIYRKYVDYYLKHGRDGYKVDPADRKLLLDLFDRGGFTDGYYVRHNGREMVALKEKPAFREANQVLFDRLDRDYVEKKKQEPLSGHIAAKEGEPLKLSLWCSEPERLLKEAAEQNPYVEVTGAEVQTAQNQPMGEDKLLKQLNKTGNTPFYFENLTAEIEGNCFVPVQALNELRREALEQMEEKMLQSFRRTAGAAENLDEGESKQPDQQGQNDSVEADACQAATENMPGSTDTDAAEGTEISSTPVRRSETTAQSRGLHISLEEPNLFPTAVAHPDVTCIYLDSCGFGPETWKAAVQECHDKGKTCSLMLPHIFRTEAEQYFRKHMDTLKEAGFDELVIKSLDELVLLRENGLGEIPMVSDANLYVMNHLAGEQMETLGISRMTLPLELNSRELETLGCEGMEFYVYGYLPAMVSAQCIVRTTKGCTKKPEVLKMKDRTGKELPVKNHCRFCYNTIYNPSPLSLLGQEKLIGRLAPGALRLTFTLETPEQMRQILDTFADHFLHGEDTKDPLKDFTRGHFKRGVE